MQTVESEFHVGLYIDRNQHVPQLHKMVQWLNCKTVFKRNDDVYVPVGKRELMAVYRREGILNSVPRPNKEDLCILLLIYG